jgi:hypothetical protein
MNMKSIFRAGILRKAIFRANIIARRRQRAEEIAKTAIHPSMFGDSLG